MVTKAEYDAAKAAHKKARKAYTNADEKLKSAEKAWCDARVEYNAELPDGFYAEADTWVLARDFPVYLKAGTHWFWHNGSGFATPDWFEEEGEMDIDLIPISEVDLTGLS